MTDGTSHPAHGTRPQARAASRGAREGCDGRPPAEWIERLIERVEATGRQMDALGGKLDRMDEKLEGVAYRRDIELFVARDEIERRIDKVVDGAKAEAAKGLAEVAGQVRDLRRIGWGLASAALLAFGGIVLAKIGLAGP